MRTDLPFRNRIVLLDLGSAYAAKSNFKEEIGLYEEMVEKHADVWWAWQYLTEAYTRCDRHSPAFDAYKRATETNPDAEWASVGLRRIQMETLSPQRLNNQVDRLEGIAPLLRRVFDMSRPDSGKPEHSKSYLRRISNAWRYQSAATT